MFFFSSRRRHTRSLCDWSSDVCSSDLRCRRLDNLRGRADARNTERIAMDPRIDAAGGVHQFALLRHKLRLVLRPRSEEHTSELQSHSDLVCRLLLEKKKKKKR